MNELSHLQSYGWVSLHKEKTSEDHSEFHPVYVDVLCNGSIRACTKHQ